MASIEAQIAIILKGTSELNKLQSKLNAIQATADQISQQAFDIDIGRVSDLTTYENALKAVNAELEKTDANFKAQSAATQQIMQKLREQLSLNLNLGANVRLYLDSLVNLQSKQRDWIKALASLKT